MDTALLISRRDKGWMMFLFLGEIVVATVIGFMISPLSGIAALISWGMFYLMLGPRYFLQASFGKRAVFHLAWCLGVCLAWTMITLSPHVRTLYVPSRHPALDSSLLQNAAILTGMLFAVSFGLRMLFELYSLHGRPKTQ